MNNGSMTDHQRSKIYDHNFDMFLAKPLLTELTYEGKYSMGDRLTS